MFYKNINNFVDKNNLQYGSLIIILNLEQHHWLDYIIDLIETLEIFFEYFISYIIFKDNLVFSYSFVSHGWYNEYTLNMINHGCKTNMAYILAL